MATLEIGEGLFRASQLPLGVLDYVGPRPSQVIDTFWISQPDESLRSTKPLSLGDSGKWMLFSPVETIDTDWLIIRNATKVGRLGFESKVATMMPSPLASSPNTKVICIHTCATLHDQDRVLQQVRELGWRLTLKHKLDKTTVAGQYSGAGQSVSSRVDYGVNAVWWESPHLSLDITTHALREDVTHAGVQESAAKRRFASSGISNAGNTSGLKTHEPSQLPFGALDYDGPRPSRVHDIFWISQRDQSLTAPKPSPLVESGKWMLFRPVETIDTDWFIIRNATKAGRLGFASKVATMKPSSLASDPNTKVICVYTCATLHDQDRVLGQLRDLGWRQTLRYKLDRTTIAGQYAGGGQPVASRVDYGMDAA